MAFGKYHEIEVEDDVTTYMEYENGMTGLFITSTGEAPGTNRLEVSGEMGKIVIENNNLTFWRNRASEKQFNKEYSGSGLNMPEYWKCEVPVKGEETAHIGIIENWVNAILKGTALLAPGIEGINGLMMSNAMHLSAWLEKFIDLPIDDELFVKEIEKRIATSKDKK